MNILFTGILIYLLAGIIFLILDTTVLKTPLVGGYRRSIVHVLLWPIGVILRILSYLGVIPKYF